MIGRGLTAGRIARTTALPFLFVLVTWPQAGGAEPSRAPQLTFQLRSGGSVSGPVAEFDEHAVVVAAEGKPYAISWIEMDPGSALNGLRSLYSTQRGGEDRLTAADHLALGELGAKLGRQEFARRELVLAERLDGNLAGRVRDTLRSLVPEPREAANENGETRPDPIMDAPGPVPVRLAIPSDPGDHAGSAVAQRPSPQRREQVLTAYRQFGSKVREVLGRDVDEIETEHFLIWTDWEPRYRLRLEEWLEATYQALCGQFELNPAEDIFLAKCPVFCFKSKAKFQRFAKDFDGYDARDAAGYTRSIEANGHVHVVLLRRGREAADFDRFAWTLVHESAHAFAHRLHSSRLIPHWVNEGLAEWTAEAVLRDRCPARETAEILGRVLARHDVSIAPLLASIGPTEVHEYPIAHSVVGFMIAEDAGRFRTFLRLLKAGEDTSTALSTSYAGWSLDQLESRWRQSRRDADSRAVSLGTIRPSEPADK